MGMHPDCGHGMNMPQLHMQGMTMLLLKVLDSVLRGPERFEHYGT